MIDDHDITASTINSYIGSLINITHGVEWVIYTQALANKKINESPEKGWKRETNNCLYI